MKKLLIYVHGQGGNAREAQHYRPLFSDYDVVGFDYKSEFPWQAEKEFSRYFDSISLGYDSVALIANSIGAYFSLVSLQDKNIEKAFFISPVVDMEKLICDMMSWAGVNDSQLEQVGEIKTNFGQTLSWEYLNYARRNPVKWTAPLHILYGTQDNLTSFTTIDSFAKNHHATLTVMQGGEHWFHTQEQMEFLDGWIKKYA